MDEKIHEDEISFKDLIMTLLNNWKMIIACTVIAAIIGGLYVFLLVTPTYESRISGTITISETASSKYGSYPFPTINRMDYLMIAKLENVLNKTIEELDLDVSPEKLKESITINHDEKFSHFSFSVYSESPDKAKDFAETLSRNFVKELHFLYKEKALDYFIVTYTTSIQNLDEAVMKLQNNIEKTQDLLDTVEPTITLKKLLLSDPVYASIIAYEKNMKLEDLTEEMMLEEVINPNYEALQDEIIDLIKQLNEHHYALERDECFLEELIEEKSKILTYHEQGDESVLTDDFLDVIDSQLIMNTEASLPGSPVSSNKMTTLAIAIILGAMIGIFIAFFKAYWKNEFNK